MKIQLMRRAAFLFAAALFFFSVSYADDNAYNILLDPAKSLLTQLHSENPKLRRESADNLGEAGTTAAAPYIIPLLNDTDEYVRQASARALGELKAGDAVTPLIDALKDPDPYVRSYAAWALGEIKDPRAVEPLQSVLSDKDGKVSLRSSEALQKFKGQDSMRLILKGLVSGVQHDDQQSARMLSQIIEREGDVIILKAFADPGDNETKTIRNYIKALSIHNNSVHPVFENGLINYKNRSLILTSLADYIRNEQDSTDALFFIGKLKDSDVFPFFKDLLKGPPSSDQSITIADPSPAEWNATDERILSVQSNETSKRRILVGQLGFMGCTTAADALLIILTDEREHLSLRGDAAEALGKIGEKKAIDPLIEILQNGKYYWRFRLSAAKALGDIRDKKAVEPLVAVLMNTREQKWLRFEAAGSLGNIGDTRAAESLEQIVHDKDPAVSNRAREALARIQGKTNH